MIRYLQASGGDVVQALQQHIVLAVLPVLIGLAAALPLGCLAHRQRWLYAPMLGASSVLYAVPSLALFVLLPGVLGTKILDPVNIVAALSIYTAALLVRTVADGLASVSPTITQAATALGYRRLGLLLTVELPIAVPVILAGVRVATVSNVSLVSVGALLGIGGLGALFTDGLQRDYLAPIFTGIALSVLLALALDAVIVAAQRLLTPWVRAGELR